MTECNLRTRDSLYSETPTNSQSLHPASSQLQHEQPLVKGGSNHNNEISTTAT